MIVRLLPPADWKQMRREVHALLDALYEGDEAEVRFRAYRIGQGAAFHRRSDIVAAAMAVENVPERRAEILALGVAAERLVAMVESAGRRR
jgi:hypothetical protein